MNKEEILEIMDDDGCAGVLCPVDDKGVLSCDECRADRILALAQTPEKPEKVIPKYPDDFKPFHGVILGDEGINQLIDDVLEDYDENSNDDWSATANILVMVTLGYIEVYQKIAEAEIK